MCARMAAALGMTRAGHELIEGSSIQLPSTDSPLIAGRGQGRGHVGLPLGADNRLGHPANVAVHSSARPWISRTLHQRAMARLEN